MSTVGIHEIGEMIRKIRKERGLRIDDVADENISPATISNLERGVPHVKQEKLTYLLEKLNVSMEKLPQLMVSEQKKLEEVRFKLCAIESMERIGQTHQALLELDQLEKPDDHPYAAEIYWLKGICCMNEKNYRRAERELTNALRLSGQNPLAQAENIEALSFNALSVCSYYRDDLHTALKYTENGLQVFNSEGGRRYGKYLLTLNKALYLERLDRIMDGMKVVEEVWKEMDQIEKIDTILGFYCLRAELLRKSGSLDSAIHYGQMGRKLASLNDKPRYVFDLWIVLGSTYTAKMDFAKAEMCFQIAMSVPEEYRGNGRYIRACIQMGSLYIQLEKWTEAEEVLQTAIDKSEAINSPYNLAASSISLGVCFFKQNRIDEAISCYHCGIGLARQYGYPEKEYQGWYQLAKCYKGRDEEQFQRCTVHMFNVQDRLNDPLGTVNDHEVSEKIW
ncbi:Transcriptional regulator, contains XRE-family HTH domain [Marininema mesophilum]|uniref:Transcriptional regulator, contains XRE-family HTH domain n=1 Tax=Marininema mesophilum TaxID=1048340 RepID=A0A1H3C273_9BACL|nr:helix-turn-helix transcriptional regulator [Marininema mesophilum]SDX48018.1 Transcriptional regulator, contains XRE-family HTH domain [Marininema mesophilum]